MNQPDFTAPPRSRSLRIGTPFWAETPNISAPCLPAPSQRGWDVIIVGTGIGGALLAEALTRKKQRVLLLDRRQPLRGSTLASTAMIQHEIDVPLHRLARQIGAKDAGRAWRRSARAVEDLLALTTELKIDCRMERKQALYLAGDDMGHRAMMMEAEARHQAGIAADYLDAAALQHRFSIDRTGAILSDISASANPAQLAAGLLAVAQARGAEIVSPAEVTDIMEFSDGVALALADGKILSAGAVVFCTGYEFLPAMQSARHRIASTWALVSEAGLKLPDWMDQMLVWEAANPYLYFRTAPGGRIVAGGEDVGDATLYTDAAVMRRKAKAIAEKLRKLTGIRIDKPAYVWAAAFGETSDGLPIIGAVPGMNRVQTVMGFGGNGITYAMIAAQVVAATLDGSTDPDADLFAYR